MSLGIGIDAGGTCTDAVVYDLVKREVLASAKSLTTKGKLSEGILNSLSKLPKELISEAKMISLSTTLATNACVEGTGGRARLFLYGADKEYAMRIGAKSGEYSEDDLYCIDTQTDYDGTVKNMPDWKKIESLVEDCEDCNAIAVVEIYSRQTGARFEKKTKELVKERLHIPAVCGYELFNDLDFIRRGGSALLNARLIPLIDEFLKAVDASLKQCDVKLSPVIVRSDGNLMSRDFAAYHPVETLLCGPVASVMGARELAKVDDALLLDMGGTTTDVAFIKDKKPLKADGGIQIGNWKTFVKGLYVETFGLGGDSAVRYNSKGMYLDERRAIPICVLAKEYPYILEELKELDKKHMGNTRLLHEFYLLQTDISNKKGFSENDRKICELLKDGPKSIQTIAKMLEIPVYYLNTNKLESEGIVIRSGLTPTDIMHIKGDYCVYDKEASYYAAKFVGRSLGVTPEELGDKVYEEVKRKMYGHLAKILMKKQFPYYKDKNFGEEAEYLIEQSWQQARNPKKKGTFSLKFEVPDAFVGIGGPIHLFLNDVAKAFGTKAIIPPHAQVANAVGAIISDIMFEIEVIVYPTYNQGSRLHYKVFSKGESKQFPAETPKDLEDACTYAKKRLQEWAVEEAKERGITGTPQITMKEKEKYYPDTTMLEEVVYHAVVKENTQEY